VDTLPGELLLAVVGLDSVIGDEPVKITQAMREEAMGLPRKLLRELRRFLTADSFDRFPAPQPLPYRKVADRLGRPPGDVEDAARIDQLSRMEHPDEQVALNLAAERALAVLRPLVPRLTRQTVTGPKLEMPPDFALAKLRRALAIVADPVQTVTNMCCGTLLREEQQTMAAVYPALYTGAADAVPALLTAIVAERPTFELPWRRDRLLKIFLGGPTMDPALAARLHQPFEPKQGHPPAPPPGAPAPDIAKAVITPVDRISAK
jgi:hypothetical protein